jgi:hypothetical protein
VSKDRYDSFYFILALESPEEAPKAQRFVEERIEIPHGVGVVIGYLDRPEEPGAHSVFVSVYEIGTDWSDSS